MDALKGIKVIELEGLAPVPFCGQILADFGADVTAIKKKKSGSLKAKFSRNKRSISLDYKDDIHHIRDLVDRADVLLDPYKPGVLEAIGLAPLELWKTNPGLIVARITGYGQTGSMAKKGGHDLNYVSLSGILPFISGKNERPWPPANVLADFAGGGLNGAFGILAAIIKRNRTGEGAVVDVSMTEGVSYLGAMLFEYQGNEVMWNKDFGLFRGDCPIYRTYQTKDDKFMAVGALEPKFHQAVFKTLDVDPNLIDNPTELTNVLEAKFKSKTRNEWASIFEKVDACVTPVLDLEEVKDSELHKSRNNFRPDESLSQPSPRIYSSQELKKLPAKL
ncbi:unnamed protein product [Bursaphelenchus xylophilus]|uniref:(pine wood nematode) hypothetical protein n=1 Tax=Bursaphelenchus xylophilus TaxID=6326 RepID=A0A1I7SM78_BURXY|nr:unnamed protein product [Bursaphelenchus xylophilus]CAG9130028.1 unnamed protein product [Bursaphelenchus xylophilus]